MQIRTTVMEILDQVELEAASRSFAASNELRNAALIVLRGRRSGRRYKVPYTGRVKYDKKNKTASITYRYYTASAPGEAPANRTVNYRQSYRPMPTTVKQSGKLRIYAAIGSNYKANGKLLGEILEAKNRPHRDRIIKKAMPAIKEIYTKPYIRR